MLRCSRPTRQSSGPLALYNLAYARRGRSPPALGASMPPERGNGQIMLRPGRWTQPRRRHEESDIVIRWQDQAWSRDLWYRGTVTRRSVLGLSTAAMPVLGADALLPIGQAPEGQAEKRLLFCEIKGLKATGHLTPNGLVVLTGSQAVLKERASAHQWPYTLATRNKLIEDGILVQDGDHLRFTRDAESSSPSAAATVVHGGSANGLLAWKDKDGKTLKELEAV